MSITLDTVTLPYDLLWEDEFAWTGVQQMPRYSLQGIQHIETSQQASGAGRTITLSSNDAWITRADLLTLHGWAQVQDKVMTLTLHDARSFKVMFRHLDPPAFEAEQIKKIAEPGNTDHYIIKFKFIVVVL